MNRIFIKFMVVPVFLVVGAHADTMGDVDRAIQEAKNKEAQNVSQNRKVEDRISQIQALADENLSRGKNYLSENGKRVGVVTLADGLQYRIIKSGTGASPDLNDKVVVHYHGTLVDGTVFDSSVQRGEPATFPVNGVIKGWKEVLQKMRVGDKWTVVIPSNLAYGERSVGNAIGPNETLIFEIELLGIEKIN